MNRRDFLVSSVFGCILLGSAKGYAGEMAARNGAQVSSASILDGIQIIDAHAHPDMDYDGTHWTDRSSSFQYIKEAGMAASSFSAVGDRTIRNKNLGISAFECTKSALDWWSDGIIKDGAVRLVRSVADLPQGNDVRRPPGAILSIEGGDALEGNLENIDAFFEMGVRIITLMHFHNNEIGDIMKPYPRMEWTAGPYRGGLSKFGHDVVAKMEDVGMVVDVAHAHPDTYKDILAVSRKPVLDSHTNPSPTQEGVDHGRMRTWKEMELVAKNGGVVCTWPFPNKGIPRLTMLDWAREILLMQRNLGIDHVGLGTDGGGYYRPMDAYHDERDLPRLAEAMLEVGLSRTDMAAYMGGNVRRVLKTCIG